MGVEGSRIEIGNFSGNLHQWHHLYQALAQIPVIVSLKLTLYHQEQVKIISQLGTLFLHQNQKLFQRFLLHLDRHFSWENLQVPQSHLPLRPHQVVQPQACQTQWWINQLYQKHQHCPGDQPGLVDLQIDGLIANLQYKQTNLSQFWMISAIWNPARAEGEKSVAKELVTYQTSYSELLLSYL